MLKSVFKGLGTVFVPKFSIKGLLATRELKDTAKLAQDLARDTFTQDEATRKESFDDAVRRFKLSGTDVGERHRRFLQIAGLFALASLLCFIYSIYLAYHGQITGLILGLAVSGLGLVYAFRYHFWAFQLKNKKLGCTLQEWWNSEVTASTEKAVTSTNKKTAAKKKKIQQDKQ